MKHTKIPVTWWDKLWNIHVCEFDDKFWFQVRWETHKVSVWSKCSKCRIPNFIPVKTPFRLHNTNNPGFCEIDWEIKFITDSGGKFYKIIKVLSEYDSNGKLVSKTEIS